MSEGYDNDQNRLQENLAEILSADIAKRRCQA